MQVPYLMKEGILLAITCPAVFRQVYRTRKKEKEKEKRNILFYKQKLNKFLNLKKGPKCKTPPPVCPKSHHGRD
jgi:hypothetical protein